MANRLITAPIDLPLSVAEVKDHLVEDSSDKDAYIAGLIQSAAGLCQSQTLRAIMSQTRELTLDAFPSTGWIEIEYPPVTGIDSIRYRDTAGDWQTLTPSSYVLDNASEGQNAWLGIASGRSWPSTFDEINSVQIRYRAGYADAASVPPDLKQWMRLIIGHWYADREAVAPSAGAGGTFEYVDKLLDIYRVY